MRPHFRAALALVFAVMLAACAGTATDDDAQTATTEATDNATEAGTESATGTDEEALDRVVQAGENTVAEGSARFTLTVESEGTQGDDGTAPITVEGEETFEEQQRQLTFQGPQGDLEMIVDGSTVYVQLPGTEDETWARAELSELLAGDVGFGGPAGLPFQSPADNLRVLGDAVTQATEAGTEDIDGESTTRYDLTIDLTRAAEEAGGSEAGSTFQLLAAQTGITELDMQVWVDEEDRIRQVAYSLDLSQADVEAATEGAEAEVDPQGTVTTTVTYSDFGADVTIELPPEDAIVDLDEAEIRGSMGGAATGSGETSDEATPTETSSP